jgi:hypothetical protein
MPEQTDAELLAFWHRRNREAPSAKISKRVYAPSHSVWPVCGACAAGGLTACGCEVEEPRNEELESFFITDCALGYGEE